jgi:8-oxo-dGTP pyrophosphatase MutT (NUDIX family)
MNLVTLVSRIQERLQQPLPGYPAQLGLYSEQGLKDYEKHLLNFEQESDKNPSRQSSVLILLYEKDGQVMIPLIQRPEYDGVHSGQIALPGGKAEPEDQDVIATALRETREEIGITSDQITVLGSLTSVYIPPSRFWVNVVLAYSQSISIFIPDQREVASVIEFPLEHLANPEYIEEREVIRSKQWKMRAPGYSYQSHFIWGATAMILTELRELIEK